MAVLPGHGVELDTLTGYAGVALMSGAALLLELTLLRLFAVQQFYHFAFIALLTLSRHRCSPVGLCLAFGAATLGAYLVINYLPFDSYSIAWDRRQVGYLLLYFLAEAAPFLFSGLLVGGELIVAGRHGADRSHRVYGANMIGSAFGCIASQPALAAFGGEGTLVLAALVGPAAGLCLLLRSCERRHGWLPRAMIPTRRAGPGATGYCTTSRQPSQHCRSRCRRSRTWRREGSLVQRQALRETVGPVISGGAYQTVCGSGRLRMIAQPKPPSSGGASNGSSVSQVNSPGAGLAVGSPATK